MRTNLKSRGVEQHKGRVGERERERWDLFFSSCPAHSISLPSFPSLLPLRLKTAAEVTVSVSVDLGDDQLVLGMGEGISHDLIHLFEQDQCTVRSDFSPPPPQGANAQERGSCNGHTKEQRTQQRRACCHRQLSRCQAQERQKQGKREEACHMVSRCSTRLDTQKAKKGNT
jgi:hypothetical protein